MANEIQLAGDHDTHSLRTFVGPLEGHSAFRTGKSPWDVVKQLLPTALRLATYRLRRLPTVVIVGAERAGATQLYTHLVHHPRCFGAADQDVAYFSKHAERSVRWYRSRFPLRRRVARRQGHVLEASPSYLSMPSGLRKMQAVVPEARLVVLLRDPVSRAFSHYQHQKTRQLESRSFARAVDDELRANEFRAERGVALGGDAKPMSGYVAGGYYGLQLELLLKLYRRNRVLFIESVDFFADTVAACDRVFSFLGLESFDVPASKVYNRGTYPDAIDPRVENRLREHYRPYDELIQDILGRPCGWLAPTARAA